MIGLIVDNPQRDLDGIILVAHHLATHGIRSAIIPMYQQGIEVPLLGLNGILLNYARLNNRELIATYKKMGLQTFVLDTEGGILSESGLDAPANWARQIKASGLGSLLDGYFFWGTELADAFRKDAGLTDDKLHVAGCPRFDFCHEPWRRTLNFPRDDFVLINCNFSAINPFFQDSEEKERQVFYSVGWDEDYIDRFLADLRKAFQSCLKTFEHLARALPQQLFLVRPHPFENPETYCKRFSNIPNIIVDGRGNVLNVIARSRCVIHLNCGTAIESIMLQRMPINLSLHNSPLLIEHTPLPAKVSYQVFSQDELVEAIRNIDTISTKFPFAEYYERFVFPWFYYNDGHAADRVASVLAKVNNTKPMRDIFASVRGGHSKPTPAQLLQGLIGNVAGPRWAAALRTRLQPARQSKEFSIGDVQPKLDALTKVAGGPTIALSARHPLTRARMSTVIVETARASNTEPIVDELFQGRVIFRCHRH